MNNIAKQKCLIVMGFLAFLAGLLFAAGTDTPTDTQSVPQLIIQARNQIGSLVCFGASAIICCLSLTVNTKGANS